MLDHKSKWHMPAKPYPTVLRKGASPGPTGGGEPRPNPTGGGDRPPTKVLGSGARAGGTPTRLMPSGGGGPRAPGGGDLAPSGGGDPRMNARGGGEGAPGGAASGGAASGGLAPWEKTTNFSHNSYIFKPHPRSESCA